MLIKSYLVFYLICNWNYVLFNTVRASLSRFHEFLNKCIIRLLGKSIGGSTSKGSASGTM